MRGCLLVLRNDGEISIGSPAIELQQVRSQRLIEQGMQAVRVQQRYDLGPNHLIYPGDRRVISDRCFLECKPDASLDDGEYRVRWTIFLDNSLPSSGEIDLGRLLMSARTPDHS